jgi:hypothetical protein
MNVKQSLESIMKLEGSIGAALVDWTTGMTLGEASGTGMFNIKLAAASNSQVVKAKLRVIKELGLNDSIEDILITLGHQYHLIRPFKKDSRLFLYLAIRRDHGNLGLARYKLESVEEDLEV